MNVSEVTWTDGNEWQWALTLDLAHVSTLLLIKVDTDLDLTIDALAAPHELVAVEDGIGADLPLNSLGLPDFADSTALLSAVTDHDIELVDGHVWERLNVEAVETDLDSDTKLGGVGAGRHALGDLGATNGAPAAHAEVEVELLGVDDDTRRGGVPLVGAGLGVGIAVQATVRPRRASSGSAGGWGMTRTRRLRRRVGA